LSIQIVHINQLLDRAVEEELYNALIVQLNKDFLLANLDVEVSENATPAVLEKQLCLIVKRLINNEFDSFLNLLYRIDLSENEIKQLPKENQDTYIASVSFLILKREWQKVWFKKNY